MFDPITAKSRARLRRLSIIAPLAGLACLYPVRLILLGLWPAAAVDAAVGALMLAGVLVCSWAVFRVIAQQDHHLAAQHRELQRRYETERRLRAQTEALHQAALTIASARTPDQTLQRLVDLARDLIGAHHATLDVMGLDGAVDDHYTSGIVEEEQARVGWPAGDALLSAPRRAHDPDPADNMPDYPPLRDRLKVPVAHRGDTVLGYFELVDRVGAREFSAEDEALLMGVAGHAAVVIQNARLTEQVRQLAARAERDRIATELRDDMIQAIYAVNLELEDASEDVEAHPVAVRQRLDEIIDRLSAVIEDIRSTILGLPPEVPAVTSGDNALQPMIEADVSSEAHPQPIAGHRPDSVTNGYDEPFSAGIRQRGRVH